MHIELTVGGALADYLPAGHSGNRVRIALSDGSSVADLLANLNMPAAQRLLIICNGQVVPSADRITTVLADEDQVSLMPPITAG